MATGPGKYDEVATLARMAAGAQGVVLIVMNGKAGSGFSVQLPAALQAALPDMLEQMARDIRADIAAGKS